MKVFLSLLCCLTLAFCAPLREDELTRALESAMSLSKKILSDIPGAHDACVTNTGLTLSSDTKSLEFLLSDIGIPAAPVLTSEDLTLDASLKRIAQGLDLHRKLLQEILGLLSSDELRLLLADVTDLSAHARQMQRLAPGSSSEAPEEFPEFSLRIHGDYQVRVAAHLSLLRLRSFTQDVFRCLRRNAASLNP